MDNDTDKTTNEVFERHYQDAMRLGSEYQLFVLNRIIKNPVLKNDWSKLLKISSRFEKIHPLEYLKNLSIYNAHFLNSLGKDYANHWISSDAENEIIKFTKSESVRCFLRCILFAYDRALYFKHHSIPDLKNSELSNLNLSVRRVEQIKRDLMKFPLFESLWKSRIKEEFGEIDPTLFDKNYEKYIKITNMAINEYYELSWQSPLTIPDSSRKKTFSNDGRNYFIKIVSQATRSIFNSSNDRIVAEITNQIFEIQSTDEDIVRKIWLSAK